VVTAETFLIARTHNRKEGRAGEISGFARSIGGTTYKEQKGEGQMTKHWATATPFEISSYDNPETIRFRKYATGTHLVVHGTEV
jgi:hypothetical protein